ncbi:uracil-DNA glycosylase [Anaplasmataceae bacterium AB001_6]|nr:uracil-DNA glycosylase [Anaplasmataceae bacterium AB001_6]
MIPTKKLKNLKIPTQKKEISSQKNNVSLNSKEIESNSYALNNIDSIDDLKEHLCNNKLSICNIAKEAKNTVFSDGNIDANIMVIGEAPGASEDDQGIPFCGASGKLLDKMFASIDLYRAEDIYITNTIFWRPPNNRRPTEEESNACLPIVEKHINLFNPKLIILVGGTALNALIKTNNSISRMRGDFFIYIDPISRKEIPTTAIFHPSYLLRQPKQKVIAWKDLQMIRKYIDDNNILK